MQMETIRLAFETGSEFGNGIVVPAELPQGKRELFPDRHIQAGLRGLRQLLRHR